MEYKRLNSFFADYAKNISRGSTFIRTKKPLPIGTQFRFHLKIPGNTDPLQLSGVVRERIRPADPEAQSKGAGMAIDFVYGSEAERQRIFAGVKERMVQSLGPRLYEELVGRHLRA